MKLPAAPPSLPQRGNALSRGLGRFALGALGWGVEGELPDVGKAVLIAAPHTSNWDFVVGISAMLALGLDVRWLGKHSIFRWPVGGLLRYWGGIPVDRGAALDVVPGAIERFACAQGLLLGIAPEGTRKKVARWKTGFHRIAVGAGVPIFPAAFDYGRRRVVLLGLFHPSGDLEPDIAALRSLFHRGMACRPEHFWDEAPQGSSPEAPAPARGTQGDRR